jgi:hypothetical protein
MPANVTIAKNLIATVIFNAISSRLKALEA